jgi:hypothetical protein
MVMRLGICHLEDYCLRHRSRGLTMAAIADARHLSMAGSVVAARRLQNEKSKARLYRRTARLSASEIGAVVQQLSGPLCTNAQIGTPLIVSLHVIRRQALVGDFWVARAML